MTVCSLRSAFRSSFGCFPCSFLRFLSFPRFPSPCAEVSRKSLSPSTSLSFIILLCCIFTLLYVSLPFHTLRLYAFFLTLPASSALFDSVSCLSCLPPVLASPLISVPLPRYPLPLPPLSAPPLACYCH